MKTVIIKEDFNSNRERKKAQKYNTSKGTMNVELNGTKSFLRLNNFFFLNLLVCGSEGGYSF